MIRPSRFYNVAFSALGAVAQLGERSVRNAEVTGSIPVGSTFSLVFDDILDPRYAHDFRVSN